MPPAPVLQICAPNTPPPTSTPIPTNTPTATTTPTPIDAPPPLPALSDQCIVQPMDSYQEITLLPRPEHYRAWAQEGAITGTPPGALLPIYANTTAGAAIDAATAYTFSTGEVRDTLILCPENAPPPPGESCENPISIWHTTLEYSYQGSCIPDPPYNCPEGNYTIFDFTIPVTASYIFLTFSYPGGGSSNDTTIFIDGIWRGRLQPKAVETHYALDTSSDTQHRLKITSPRNWDMDIQLTLGSPVDIQLADIPTDGQYHTVFDACVEGFPIISQNAITVDGIPSDSGIRWRQPDHRYSYMNTACDHGPAEYIYPYRDGNRFVRGKCYQTGGAVVEDLDIGDVMFTYFAYNAHQSCGQPSCPPTQHQITLKGMREVPQETPTPTPPPTATPLAPAGCYVQQLSALGDDRIAFPTDKDVYEWYSQVSYQQIGGAGVAGELESYGGAALTVAGGETWNFTSPDDPAALLICPASAAPSATPTTTASATPTMTPTMALTPTATLAPFPVPDECFMVESEYRTDRRYYTRWPASFNTHSYDSAIALFHTADWRFKADAPVSHISYSQATESIYYATYTYGAETWMEFNTAGIGFMSDQSFRMMACPPSDMPTPTMPPSPTSPATATPTGSVLEPAECVEPITSTQAARLGGLPALAVELPTFEPVQPVTATVVISVAVVSETLDSMFTGMITPQMQIQTATAGYSWEQGHATVQGWSVWLQPALDWLAIVNPSSPAWTNEGTYLWALSPVLLPLAPLLIAGVVVVVVRYWFWFLDMFQRVIEFIIKLIELIPGM
jgi:hypothetical protein